MFTGAIRLKTEGFDYQATADSVRYAERFGAVHKRIALRTIPKYAIVAVYYVR